VPNEHDLNLIREASADPLIPLISSVPSTWSDAEGSTYIERQIARPAQGLGWSLTIVDAETQVPAGNIFIDLSLQSVGGASVGYWIVPSQRGKGLAADALRLIRDWAPAEFKVERLTLYIEPDNAASLRTAAAAGFVAERRLSTFENVGDRFAEMICHGYGAGGQAVDRAVIGRVEHRMWMNGYRDDATWFDHWLHEDFLEFGRSGTVWTRPKIMAQQIGDTDVALPLDGLEMSALSDDMMLVTYRSDQGIGPANRSSLWLRDGDEWRLRFHQGTAAT
jgi:RimJ/RimL family protein N-acetyltransferase